MRLDWTFVWASDACTTLLLEFSETLFNFSGARSFCTAVVVAAAVVTIPPKGPLTGPRPTGPPIGPPTDQLTGPPTDHPTPPQGDHGGGGVRTAQNCLTSLESGTIKKLRNAEEGGPDAELGAKSISFEC